MSMDKRTLAELYFAAVDLKEAVEPLILAGELQPEIEQAYYRLDRALEEWRGSDNKPEVN